MNKKFPRDIVFLIVGPFLIAFIALGLSSIIYHATNWNRESVIPATLGGTIVCVLAAWGYIKRRYDRGHRPSAKPRDEPTRTI